MSDDHQPQNYTIFCVILGETTSFSVDIASNKTVGHLKDAIKENIEPRFAGVAAYELALYRVDISGSRKAMIEELKKMAEDFGQREDLHPFCKLTEIYPTAPPEETIHILVQPPQTERAGTETDSKSNVPAIVGGTVEAIIGGILILAIIIIIIIRRKRRNQRVDDGGDVIGGLLILMIIVVIIIRRKRRNQRVDDSLPAPQMKRTDNPPLVLIDSSTARRDRTVDALYQRLNRYHLVMVRGTPASGKSTLAQLLVEHISTREPGADPILISSWPRDGTSWLKKLTNDYKPKRRNIIIIDEAQLTYWDTSFWNSFLKPLVPKSLDRVILFASYGSPTARVSAEGTLMVIPDRNRVSLRPVDHADDIAPAGLFLTPDEFADMVKKLHLEGRFEDNFLDYVLRVTAGHTGAVGDLLRIVSTDNSYRRLKHEDGKYSLEIFQSQFPIAKLWSGLDSSGIFRRGLPMLSELQELPVARVFHKVLSNNNVTKQMLDLKEDQDALDRCFNWGWLHATTDQTKIMYIFTTPLHQWFVEYYLGTRLSDPTVITDQDLCTFAIKVIRRFSPQQLSSPREIGASSVQRPPEAQFQDEFYRCCHEYAKGSLISFPEYEGASGRIDFYIPLKKWGLELLLDGDRPENYSSSFTIPGACAKMHFEDYIILDFRTARPQKRHPEIQKLYHVVFKDDEYKQVEIQEGTTLRTVDSFELLNS